MPELVVPHVRFERSYCEAECERTDKTPLTPEQFAPMLESLAGLRDGSRVPEGFVQTLELWLVEGDEYLGKVQLRTHTGPYQGHIGIAIRPSRRRQGLARVAAALSRPHLAALGVHEIIATCDPSNDASRALIESLGGILVDAGTMLHYVVR